MENLLRDGVGYFAAPERKNDARNYINELSADRFWVACDCKTENDDPPQLWPVTGGWFRRDRAVDALTHDNNCEFRHPPHSPQDVRRSFGRKALAPDGLLKFRLATGFVEHPETAAPGTENPKQINRSTKRPGLARLLAELFTAAGLQEIQPNDHFASKPMLATSIRSIKTAATRVEIAPGRLLSDWLAVGIGELSSLKKRIERSHGRGWGGSRPHGILICNVHEVQRHQLTFNNDRIAPEPILGRIAVFGEKEAVGRQPYLVACLVGKPSAQATTAALLRAYAHPCLNWIVSQGVV